MRDFLLYINRFRGIAILFVVFSHCIRLIDWNNKDIEMFFSSFFVEGTTLFVFISGYLFEHLKYKFEIKKYFTAKVKNVILPYLIVSIPAIFVYLIGLKTEHSWILTDDFNAYPNGLKILIFYITGAHLGPLWYIPMASLLFLVSPILLKINKKGYMLPFLFITLFLAYYYPKPLNNSNNIQAFLHYLFIYVLGMFCSNKKETLNIILTRRKIFVFMSTVLIFLFILSFKEINHGLFTQKTVFSFWLISFFLFYEKSNRQFEYLDVLAKYSFGIFFIHGYFISSILLVFKKFNIQPSHPMLFIFLSSLILLFCCCFIWLAKRILGKFSRFIVGC